MRLNWKKAQKLLSNGEKHIVNRKWKPRKAVKARELGAGLDSKLEMKTQSNLAVKRSMQFGSECAKTSHHWAGRIEPATSSQDLSSLNEFQTNTQPFGCLTKSRLKTLLDCPLISNIFMFGLFAENSICCKNESLKISICSCQETIVLSPRMI